MTKLISFSGLPGTGKTTLASAMAKHTRALYLHVDEIQKVLKRNGHIIDPASDAGYRAAQAVAETNLRLGRSVILDAVNPLTRTRGWWEQSADTCNAKLFMITLECSDRAMHRHRIDTRRDGPTWNELQQFRFEPHVTAHLRLDTARLTADACLLRALKALKDHERKLLKGM